MGLLLWQNCLDFQGKKNLSHAVLDIYVYALFSYSFIFERILVIPMLKNIANKVLLPALRVGLYQVMKIKHYKHHHSCINVCYLILYMVMHNYMFPTPTQYYVLTLFQIIHT